MARDDIDLEYFRARLEEMRASFQGQVGQIEEDYDLESATPSSSYGAGNHPADEATDVFDRERYRAVENEVGDELRLVEQALQRIEDGTYGICAVSGKPIPVERLEARPMAATLVEYQDEYDRETRGAD
jgi:RNA polymerase-binding transcription factor DksA